MIATSCPLRVLVVDDDEDSVEACGELLRFYGHEVRLARGAAAAMSVLEGWEPDVALLDLRMPGVSGFDLARLIRARAGAGPLLVAVTGMSGAAARRQAGEAGFDRLLVKPVDPDVMTALLRGHAVRLGLHSEACPPSPATTPAHRSRDDE